MNDDYRAARCGHNFPPAECQAEVCGYRDALKELEACRTLLAEIADAPLKVDLLKQENAKLKRQLETVIVYLVGSNEYHFISDRVFLDQAQAIAYCESRKNSRYEWHVVLQEVGTDWIHHKMIHRTTKGTT